MLKISNRWLLHASPKSVWLQTPTSSLTASQVPAVGNPFERHLLGDKEDLPAFHKQKKKSKVPQI